MMDKEMEGVNEGVKIGGYRLRDVTFADY